MISTAGRHCRKTITIEESFIDACALKFSRPRARNTSCPRWSKRVGRVQHRASYSRVVLSRCHQLCIGRAAGCCTHGRCRCRSALRRKRSQQQYRGHAVGCLHCRRQYLRIHRRCVQVLQLWCRRSSGQLLDHLLSISHDTRAIRHGYHDRSRAPALQGYRSSKQHPALSHIYDAGAVVAALRTPCFDWPGRFIRNCQGQTVLETALILPIATMFVFGILQSCIFVYCYIGGTYACRAAVRYAVTHGSASTSPCTAASLQNQVRPFLLGLPQSDAIISPTWSPDNNPGGTVTVKIAFAYPLNIPFNKSLSFSAVATASGVITE